MSTSKKPAYLVACGTFLGGTPNEEYGKRASGPAQRAGLTPIAGGAVGDRVQVLEGELPGGAKFMAIEQFESMEKLRGFWFSDEYQSAIPFRKDLVKMHFIAALEATTPEELAAQLAQAQKKE